MSDAEQTPSEILARRNVQNIAVKLKAGKTLTTSERKALNEFQSEQTGGWVKDLSALAKELGMSRQGIYDVRNRFPDAPKKHDDGKRENLTAWQAFCAEHLIGRDTATKNLADLKAELIRPFVGRLVFNAQTQPETPAILALREVIERGQRDQRRPLTLCRCRLRDERL
jgi:hypothetical protein